MTGTGYVVRTAANTFAQRTLLVTGNSGITLTNADGVSGDTTINVASTPNNASDNLVLRDGNGDFAAGTITANLGGNLTNVTTTANNLIPAADSTYNLGSNTVRWAYTYSDNFTGDSASITQVTGNLGGNLTNTTSTAKNFIPAADSTWNLGSNTVRWAYTYSDSIVADSASITQVTGDLGGNLTNTTSTAKNLIPAADSTWNLGSNTVRWAYVYADSINATSASITQVTGDLGGNLTNNTTTSRNIIPAADSTWNLGSNTDRYAYT